MTIFKSILPEREIPEVPLTQFVLSNAKNHLQKAALIDGPTDFTITYEQLTKMVFAISKNLYSNFNATKGQVFGILLPNHPLYAAYFHGAASAGLTITTINPLYTESELRKQLQDSGARFLLTIPMFSEKVQSAISNTGIDSIFVLSQEANNTTMASTIENSQVKVYNAQVLLAPPTDLSPVPVQINPKEDVVILPYSSGTTGVNKGVKLTHYNLVSNLVQIGSIENYDETLKVIGILPMFHIYGMTLILNKALEVCGTVVSVPKFDFVEFLTLVQKHRLTHLHLVPPIILALAKQPAVAKFDVSSVKTILSGAAPLAPTLAEEVNKKFGIIVKQGYGMTESSPVTCLNTNEDNRYGSSGILLSNTEVKVVNVETGEDLNEGEEGELCFRGPQVMIGYLNNEEATNNTIKNGGWLHTGDIGYVKENHIYITDRLKELIKFKGFQVPPAELEAILLKHEKIADAAVIGVPDQEAGELPKAFVVKKKKMMSSDEGDDLTESEVFAHVASQVAPYKKLRFVEFVDEIPKSSAGKVLRRVLKERESLRSTTTQQQQ